MGGAYDIFDGHQHFGSLASVFGAVGGATGSAEWEAEELRHRLELMDSQVIRQAVIIAGHAYLRPNGLGDTQQVNNGIASYRDRLPERFPVAVGVAEPLYGEVSLREVERCHEELGLVGISFHVRFQGVSLESPWVYRIIESMGPLGMIPFLHAIGNSEDESLWKIEALATDFPDQLMFVLDGFSDFEQARELVRIAERRGEFLFDTGLSYSSELIEVAIRHVGAERFFFGSDAYSWPVTRRRSHILSEILESGLSEQDKKAVLGGNLRRALELG